MDDFSDAIRRGIAIGFFMASVMSWFFPTYNGLLAAVNVSDGEGRIIGAILSVGAAILWFMPSKSRP